MVSVALHAKARTGVFWAYVRDLLLFMLGVSSPAGEFPTQFALIQLGTNTRDPEFLVLSGKDCAADAVHRIRSQPLLRESAQKEKKLCQTGHYFSKEACKLQDPYK